MNDNTIILSVNPRDRLTLATTIERLINLLDAMEPDVDLEEGGDAEPWLGWPERGPSALAKDSQHDDREDDGDDLEPNGDETDYDGGEADAALFIWGGGEDAPRNHSGL